MNKWLAAAAGAAVSGAALFYSTGLHPLWWMVWLAPLPVLLLARWVGLWRSFGMATVAWMSGGLNLWTYLRRLEIPPVVIVLFLAIPALVFALGVLLFGRLLRQGATWRATLLVPMLWVSYEFLFSMISPHSTFGNLGYTQMDCLPLLQIVSVTGIWGLSFCVLLFPSAIAVGVSGNGGAGTRVRIGVAAGAFLIGVTGLGWWRLAGTPIPTQSITVALVATDINPSTDEGKEQLVRSYASQVEKAALGGAQVIVLPEKIAWVTDEVTSHWDEVLGSSASAAKAMVVAGIDRGTATQRWNEARLYSPNGTLEGVYDKHHMIPGFEDVDQKGSKLLVLKQSPGIWGVEICKDMDFPKLSRQYGQQGVGLLLVPAWDFVRDGWLHGRMAVMRGAESGFTIARSAKQGVLSISDDRGRILAEKSTTPEASETLLATVPVRHSETVYARLGDWFGWLNVLGLLLILLLPRREKPMSVRDMEGTLKHA